MESFKIIINSTEKLVINLFKGTISLTRSNTAQMNAGTISNYSHTNIKLEDISLIKYSSSELKEKRGAGYVICLLFLSLLTAGSIVVSLFETVFGAIATVVFFLALMLTAFLWRPKIESVGSFIIYNKYNKIIYQINISLANNDIDSIIYSIVRAKEELEGLKDNINSIDSVNSKNEEYDESLENDERY